MKRVMQEKPSYRLWACAVTLVSLTVLIWWFGSSPVLLHTHIVSKSDYQLCGAYNEQTTGITILNPFRSRAPEHVAEVFMQAASRAQCSPDVSDALCRFVVERPLPAKDWRLVNRQDYGNEVRLFYKLNGPWQAKRSGGCLVAEVRLKRTSASWKTVGFGVSG